MKAKRLRSTLKIGRRYHGFVEVLDGVDAGTEVVIEGALKLRDGSDVKVIGE